MNKTQRQVFTAIGVIVGLVAGVFVFQKVVGNKMIEAPDFVKAVFAGGLVGIALYLLIKDGIPFLLGRRGGDRPARSPAPRATAPARTTVAPQAAATKRKEPLRAAGRERPLRTERPLKPRD